MEPTILTDSGAQDLVGEETGDPGVDGVTGTALLPTHVYLEHSTQWPSDTKLAPITPFSLF